MGRIVGGCNGKVHKVVTWKIVKGTKNTGLCLFGRLLLALFVDKV
jgi:hypothetical protein